ncbi:MAG: hypothetical protein FJ137_14020 [Deltaproteobacteria bacterium]|nr:hypothetical protein [Deltaproteobacteria bacterium]
MSCATPTARGAFLFGPGGPRPRHADPVSRLLIAARPRRPRPRRRGPARGAARRPARRHRRR